MQPRVPPKRDVALRPEISRSTDPSTLRRFSGLSPSLQLTAAMIKSAILSWKLMGMSGGDQIGQSRRTRR